MPLDTSASHPLETQYTLAHAERAAFHITVDVLERAGALYQFGDSVARWIYGLSRHGGGLTVELPSSAVGAIADAIVLRGAVGVEGPAFMRQADIQGVRFEAVLAGTRVELFGADDTARVRHRPSGAWYPYPGSLERRVSVCIEARDTYLMDETDWRATKALRRTPSDLADLSRLRSALAFVDVVAASPSVPADREVLVRTNA